jgi:DNA protecting protein DprA
MHIHDITQSETIHTYSNTGLLQNIPDKPKELFFEGNQQLLHATQHVYVCIVGPRKSSAYGTDVVTTIIKHLAHMHVITVSGAAYGIDGIVHTLSIEHGIPTIAVPGSGIDDEVFYPRAHLDLKHRILEHGGLIVNEFNPLSRASPWSFPVRNRLMAGMSHLTIVIEAEQSSGTLITAHLATDYGREVIAIPGSIYSPSSRGTHELISKGATIFTSIDTLTEVLTNIAKIHCIELWKHPIDTVEVTNMDTKHTHPSLSEKEKNILACVHSFPEGITKEHIAETLSMTSMDVSIYVTILELHGLVKMSLGKVYIKR